MSTSLYSLLIKPIELFIEFIFFLTLRYYYNVGLAVIVVSVVVNFLVLPLYKKSDALQEKERQKQKKMGIRIKQIRKAFRGDERFMMISTYYRQQSYRPIYALRGSVSLLLQIPFFIAAYRFLSNQSVLQGASFLFIDNLGVTDRLLRIGEIRINVLPVLMTCINIVSSALYTKGFSGKEKFQLYGMAVLFLVLLYNSPSGLVLYWTCNNIFSLLKNLFARYVSDKEKGRAILSMLGGISVFYAAAACGIMVNAVRKGLFLIILTLMQIPMLKYMNVFSKLHDPIEKIPLLTSSFFWMTETLLAVFAGFLIPLSVVSTSPQEFIGTEIGPYELVLTNGLCFAGLCLIWIPIFYYLSGKNGKVLLPYGMWIFAVAAIVNFMVFSKSGQMSAGFVYDAEPMYPVKEQLLNIGVLFVTVFLFLVAIIRFHTFAKRICLILTVSAVGLSLYNTALMVERLGKVDSTTYEQRNEYDRILPISTDGKNVIVFMLDRAISGYVPYIFNEFPDLRTSFEGFTFYPNTVSYGENTKVGTPPIFGGYEYVPLRINKRDKEKMVDKQNEALKVMPRLFSEENYSVTVCDPPYAGYTWIPDISIFDDCPDVNAYVTEGVYMKNMEKLYNSSFNEIQKESLFWHCIFRISPSFLQPYLYNSGNYYSAMGRDLSVYRAFLKSYSVLDGLCELTEITSGCNSFLMMQNGITHEPNLLKLPEYIPADNPEKPPADYRVKTDGFGSSIVLETDSQLMHYEVNAAALLRLGEWFDYLKNNDVWDNTRIIIVSDHGAALNQFDGQIIKDGIDIMSYTALLLVKDFNAVENKINDDFMTTADVPVLAMSGLIDNPVNVFTGNPIVSEKENKTAEIATGSGVKSDDSTVIDIPEGSIYEVSENIFRIDNWKCVG